MNGLHLTADLRRCQAPIALLTQPSVLAPLAQAAIARSGLTVVSALWHRFGDTPDSGFTGVFLLAESHVALHTWPELGSVTLDVYVCNYSGHNDAKAQSLLTELVALFNPQTPGDASHQSLRRGFAQELP